MSIGTVLEQLRGDFPDVTISKIRFLESEGLVAPARTRSGYRRFSVADCERLRFVLTAQRDHYLPLKVIKQQLDEIDGGGSVVSPLRQPRSMAMAPGLASPESFRNGQTVRITRAELCKKADVDDRFVDELVQAGLVEPSASGFFDEDAVALASTVREMSEFGLGTRHLRAFKAAADREAGLVAQIAGPIARGTGDDARGRADEVVRELAALSVTLHSYLVKSAVRGALDT